MTQAKYFDVCLIYKPTKKASPFVSVRIYCMRAENKDDAKARALSMFALAGHHMQITDVVEL
jgi:hypothetical protein